MATSGSAERGSHIWNPKAGGRAPAGDFIQVSVIAKDLVTADVWATAAFAEGERAIEHLNGIEDLEALFVYPSGELAATEGLIKLLARPNPET
jgi:thiamine biosynthesis lipoprotein